ncbi:MAG: single-stranded DNA-binding protein [Rhodobacteraceae bacterium]|nr:single-stranded DNA-binding protein [Paracoccaceae bacterium]
MLNNTVNRVILIAQVEKPPETRDFPSGGQVCNLQVKTSEKWTDRTTGEERETAQFNRVGIYVKPFITQIENEVRQGDLVYIEGRMETRKTIDQSTGEDKFWTEVSVRPYHGSFAKLSTNTSPQTAGSSQPSNYNQSRQYGQTTNLANSPAQSSQVDDGDDEEIPF